MLLELHVFVCDSSESVQSPAQANLGTRGDLCKTGSDHPEDESAAEGIETRDKREDDEGHEKHESQVDSWQLTRIRRRGEPQASLGLLIQCCTAC